MKKTYLVVALGILALVCGYIAVYLFFRAFDNQTTQYNDCASAKITDDDVDFVNNYRKDLFATGDWSHSFVGNSNNTYSAWTNNPTSGAVSINNFILCNANVEKLKVYLTDEEIAKIMENYDKYDLTDSCQDTKRLLYEFKAARKSKQYDVRIWVEPLKKPHHAFAVVLVFPEYNSELMEKYSQELFSELPICKQ